MEFMKCLKKLARPRGVEPLTPRSVVWCSIQLSYGRLPRAGRRCAAATTTPPRSGNARRIVAPAVPAGCCRNHIGRMGLDTIAPHETAADDPATRPSIALLAGRHRRAEAGHPWIYSNEVAMDDAAKALAPGSLVSRRRADGSPLGVAMFNPHTLLAARLLDRDMARPIGGGVLARPVRRAPEISEGVFRGDSYPLVHAEADGLPGLVVDRFGAVLVVQSNAAGMARLEAGGLA